MNLHCIVFGILFAIISISFFKGSPPRWLNLWRNTSPEEKSRININALYKNVSAIFFIASFLFIISGVSQVFLDHFFIWGILGWFILTGLDISYISKSQKFIKNN